MKSSLIIDADWNFGRLLTQNLRREGYSVIQASNLDEARKMFADRELLVIASALLLPDGNGFELLDYVHQMIPVVVFSNYGQDIVAESILQRGATRYFCRSEIDRLQETIMDFAMPIKPCQYRNAPSCTVCSMCVLIRSRLGYYGQHSGSASFIRC